MSASFPSQQVFPRRIKRQLNPLVIDRMIELNPSRVQGDLTLPQIDGLLSERNGGFIKCIAKHGVAAVGELLSLIHI